MKESWLGGKAGGFPGFRNSTANACYQDKVGLECSHEGMGELTMPLAAIFVTVTRQRRSVCQHFGGRIDVRIYTNDTEALRAIFLSRGQLPVIDAVELRATQQLGP